MSYTALDLITASLNLIGVGSIGEPLAAEDVNTGLGVLNELIDQWNLDPAMMFDRKQITVPLTVGVSSYTIGPSGSIISIRPVRIESASMLKDGSTVNADIVEDDVWDTCNPKTATGTPSILHPKYNYPNVTIELFPVPDAVLNMTVTTWTQFTAMSLTTVIDLPPGYRMALKYNLAVLLGNEYTDITIKQAIYAIAAEAKADVQRVNLDRPVLQLDSALKIRW